MALFLLLSLQAAAAAPPPPPPEPAATDFRSLRFDLSQYRPSDPACGLSAGSDIVVCARPHNDYPYERMERLFASGPLDAETPLSGPVTGRAFVEQVAMPGGQTSKRVMVGIRMPF